MEKISKEKVMHVAELGRLYLNEEEVEKFSYQLKSLFDEIDKINNIDINQDEVLITPSINKCEMFEDEMFKSLYSESLVNNAPKRFDNYVEVRGVFNE